MAKTSIDPRARFYVVPIFVVGTYNPDGRPNLAVAAWGGTVSFVPPRLAIYMRPTTQSCRNILQRGAFTVGIPSHEYARQVDLAGTRSGEQVDKFAESGLTPVPSLVVDAPYVDEFPVVAECRLLETRETGIHLEIVADVLDIKAEEEMLTKKGFPAFDQVKPLLFAPEDGLYHSLGEPVGRAFKMNPKPEAPGLPGREVGAGAARPEAPGERERVLFPHQRAHKLNDEERLRLLPEERLVELLQLRENDDIADLGSGTGFYTNRIARYTGGTVYAVELQKEMQEKHVVGGVPANVRLLLEDGRELPLADGSLDAVLSVYTFHEMPEETGIQRAAAALRPGGRLLIVDWRRAEEAAGNGPPLEARYSREEVERLLQPHFSKVEGGEVDRFLYWVRGTK